MSFKPYYLAIDTETEGVDYFSYPFCISACSGDSTWFWHLEDSDLSELRMLMSKAKGLVFHNAKFDLRRLEMIGLMNPLDPTFDWTFIHDTECLSHLLNEQQPKSLARLAKDFLGKDTDEKEELRKVRRKLKLKKSDGYQNIPRDIIMKYAMWDAEATWELFMHLAPQVFSDSTLKYLYEEEQRLLGILYKMENKGLKVDLGYVENQAQLLSNKILELEVKLRDLVGKEEFNPDSYVQVQAAFKERNISLESTNKHTLLGVQDELAMTLLEYRRCKKIYKTYIVPLLQEQRDGIIHPNFKQWGTRGRRFSSGQVEV
ncbi:MAG: DNA polymerase [Halobacteria archaeon]